MGHTERSPPGPQLPSIEAQLHSDIFSLQAHFGQNSIDSRIDYVQTAGTLLGLITSRLAERFPHITAMSLTEQSFAALTRPWSNGKTLVMDDVLMDPPSCLVEALASNRLVLVLVRLLAIIRCNAMAVIHCSSDALAEGAAHTESIEERRLASGLFPVGAMVNHACRPNMLVNFDGTQLTMRACRDIAAHEELSISYGPHYVRMPVAMRNRMLNEQYFFNCDCNACTESVSIVRGLLCPCGGSVSDYSSACLACKMVLKPAQCDDISSRWASIDSLRRKAALEIAPQSLQTMLECIGLLEKTVHPEHKLLGRARDEVARLLAETGKWQEAALQCKMSASIAAIHFGEDSLEHARELFKLAQLLANAKQVSLAKNVAIQAARSLRLHGETVDAAELDFMIAYLQV